MKVLSPAFFSLSALLSIVDALPNDYLGLGHLIAQNASYTFYPEQIKTAGCISNSFSWTLDKTQCGTFYSQRGKFYKRPGHYQYVLKSQNGLCGLGEKDRVVCGRWAGEGLGPLNGTDDGKGASGREIPEGAPRVLKEGSWWAVSEAFLNVPSLYVQAIIPEKGRKLTRIIGRWSLLAFPQRQMSFASQPPT